MKRLPLLFISILFSLGAQADGLNIKPGLWEIQHHMNVNGQQMQDMQAHAAEMQKHMAEMPPAMQERMKAMMAKNGMGMTDKGMAICVTADQIAHGFMGANDPKSSGCKTVDMKHSGNHTTMKMHCDAPHQADSTTDITRLSDTQWTSITHMTTEKSEINSESSGKWLKADCGDVKPLAPLEKK